MAETLTRKQVRELAAGPVGMFISAVANTVSGASVTINKLSDAAPDPDRMRDTFITKDGADYRRIADSSALPQVSLSSALTGLQSGEAVGVYFILNPEQMNDVIAQEMIELFTLHRESIAIVNNNNEYTLPTWVQTRSQVADVRLRDASGTFKSEEEYAGVQIQETDNVVTLKLSPVITDTTLTLVVLARKYYGKLATDADITTCPEQLLVPTVQVGLMRRAILEYGEAVKRLFTLDMAVTEKRLAGIRQKIIEPYNTQAYRDPEQWGNTLAQDLLEWTW